MGNEGLHHVDLRFEIVFLERTFPDDLDAELFGCLGSAGVDRLPELVRRPFGNDRDAGGTRALCGRLVALARRDRERKDENGPGERPCHHRGYLHTTK